MSAVDFPNAVNATPCGNGEWKAQCPSHDDQIASLSIKWAADRWLLKCHAGCATEAVVAAMGLTMADLFDNDEPVPTPQKPIPSKHRRVPAKPAPPMAGCTLAQYAAAKYLPLDFLTQVGLTEVAYQSQPSVRIPYMGHNGNEAAVRFRTSLTGDRFRWRKGSKPCLYGLNRLRADDTVVVEGESDTHVLWFHGVNAVGLPGASQWNDDRDAHHLGDRTVYVVVEPDKGGETVRDAFAKSSLRDYVRLVDLGGDVCDFRELDADTFEVRFSDALKKATPLSQVLEAESAEEAELAWQECAELAQRDNILDAFGREIVHAGVVGEDRNAKLLYLAITSRLLDRPVSVVIKGPSSGGKSNLVSKTTAFFPDDAIYELSSMSERALAYGDEPLQHRVLIIFEYAGLNSDFGSYLLRSLLSENVVRYEFVEKGENGRMQNRVIERQGPTGLIVTTTEVNLHPENETRLFSITVTDTPDQTRAVFHALADDVGAAIDYTPWQALQTWLSLSETRVAIPYAKALADLIPPVAVRLRRDFAAMLSMIRAHAILHQTTRQRDDDGRIIATIADYAAIRDLIVDVIGDSVGATVNDTVRETVAAVRTTVAKGKAYASAKDIEAALKLGKDAANRRIRKAASDGYLVNNNPGRGKKAEYVIGDQLPDQIDVLPKPSDLPMQDEGDIPPPPPISKTVDSEERIAIQTIDGGLTEDEAQSMN